MILVGFLKHWKQWINPQDSFWRGFKDLGGKIENKKNNNNKKGPRSPWLEITGIYSRNTDGKFPVSPDIILHK